MADAQTMMAEVTAAVACREAARLRRPIAIGLAPGCWHVSAGGEPLAGERVLTTLQPGEVSSRVFGRVIASLGALARPDSAKCLLTDKPVAHQGSLFGDDDPDG